MGPEGPHDTNTEACKIEYRSFPSNCRSLQNREEKAARIQRMGPGGLHDTSTEAFKIDYRNCPSICRRLQNREGGAYSKWGLVFGQIYLLTAWLALVPAESPLGAKVFFFCSPGFWPDLLTVFLIKNCRFVSCSKLPFGGYLFFGQGQLTKKEFGEKKHSNNCFLSFPLTLL